MGSELQIHADVPGMGKDDIKVEVRAAGGGRDGGWQLQPGKGAGAAICGERPCLPALPHALAHSLFPPGPSR